MPHAISNTFQHATLAVALTFLIATGTASSAGAQAQPSDSARLANFLALTRMQLQHPVRTSRAVQTTVTIGKRENGSPLLVHITRPAASGAERPNASMSNAETPNAITPNARRTTARTPVVILVHGGLSDDAPVRPSAWQIYKDWGTALASHGVAAVMFDHSLGSPVRRLDLSLREIDEVQRWLKSNGARLGLQTDSISALGFSAAGLLAPELLRDERPLPITRFALVYPLTGIVPAAGVPSTDSALAARMDLGKSANRIAERRTSLLIIRAGSDAINGLLSLLDQNVSALLNADARVEMINVPGEPHSFDMMHNTPDVRAAIERVLQWVAPTPQVRTPRR